MHQSAVLIRRALPRACQITSLVSNMLLNHVSNHYSNHCFERIFNYWEPCVGILGTISGEFRLTLDRFWALFRDWRHQLGTILDKFDHFGCLIPLHGCMGAHFGQNNPKVHVPRWPKRRPKMTKNRILCALVFQWVFRRLSEPFFPWFLVSFDMLLGPSLVCFCIPVRKCKTAFGLHRRVRIAYPAIHGTFALVPFFGYISMLFQCKLLGWFSIDFEVILRGLGAPFLALWTSFFESFFTSALGRPTTGGGTPPPDPLRRPCSYTAGPKLED